MKKLIAALALATATACTAYDAELQAHLEAERDFHAHQSYLESIYTQYDPEYIDDCLTYVELVCEFE
jgi:hypothetical protein